MLARNLIEKSRVLDPIPAKVLMDCYTDLLPVITKIVNDSVETATVPDILKCAALDPRLKKRLLKHDEYSSFPPISNHGFKFYCCLIFLLYSIRQTMKLLLPRLSYRYGITGKAHKWFESYLNERVYSASFGW